MSNPSGPIHIDYLAHHPPNPRPGERVRLIMGWKQHRVMADYTAGTPGEGSQHQAIAALQARLMKLQGLATPHERGHTETP